MFGVNLPRVGLPSKDGLQESLRTLGRAPREITGQFLHACLSDASG
jgi:hypothetical protein